VVEEVVREGGLEGRRDGGREKGREGGTEGRRKEWREGGAQGLERAAVLGREPGEGAAVPLQIHNTPLL